MRRLVFIIIVLVAGAATAATPDKNQTKGFAPDRVYQLGELDSVDLQNGNLIVRIPIGQAYTVGPSLSYQFVLTYNGKIWDYEFAQTDTASWRYSVPEKRSNAGFGWKLTLGELLPPEGTVGPRWRYIAPDGAESEFKSPLGSSDDADPSVAYAYNGTYLRLRRVDAETREIDFPDGTVKQFSSQTGTLKEMRDRHGNWVKLDSSDASKWIVTDGYGTGSTSVARTHTIYFSTATAGTYDQNNFAKKVSRVELAAFNGGTATYELVYDESQTVGRGGGGERFGSPSKCVSVPLLTSILLPDSTNFTPSYRRLGATENCASTEQGDTSVLADDSGAMSSLELPTHGSLEWSTGIYALNLQSCAVTKHDSTITGSYRAEYTGVTARKFKDATGGTLQEWTYHPRLTATGFGPTTGICGTTQRVVIPDPSEEFVNVVHSPGGLWTKHRFSAYPLLATNPTSRNNFVPDEQGLPLSHLLSKAGRFISTEIYDCSSEAACSPDSDGHPTTTPQRRTYVNYAREPLYSGGAPPAVPRLELSPYQVTGQRTEYELGTTCANEPCYADVQYSESDNYGHFKTTVTKSNFQSPAEEDLTSRTGYAPVDTAAVWLPDLYTDSWTRQGSVAAKKLAVFDSATGSLLSLRNLKASGSDPDAFATSDEDFLSVWCIGARGFVASERRVGGSAGGANTTRTDICASTTRKAKHYYLDHTYTFTNTVQLKRHQARYASASADTVDEELDAQAGLVNLTRDSAGLATSYAYDASGRITEVHPSGQAWTEYAYDPTASPPTVRARLWKLGEGPADEPAAVPLKDDHYYYDGLGRLIQSRTEMPPTGMQQNWSATITDYDAAGRVASVSMPEYKTNADYAAFTPTSKTTYAHDVFGRATVVTAPDGTKSTTDYTGTRKRVMKVTDTSTRTRSTEEYDGRGRLVKVTEPSGATSSTNTTGSDTTTAYAYDFADHLISVSTTAAAITQTRSFDYDPRGFLTSETHPEKGTSGNGTVTYSNHDAAGREWTRTEGSGASAITTTFEYDESERLHLVKDASGQVVKQFDFASANVAGNNMRGKLRTATRYNFLNAGNIRVTETFTYGGVGGRVSQKSTKVERESSPGVWTEINTFSLGMTYEADFALPSQITYPTCSGCATASALSSVSQQFSTGLLTGITGFATLTYHPTGMVADVARSQSEHDSYSADSGMARPKTIAFSGLASCAAPAQPVIDTPSSVCASSTSNHASVTNAVDGVTYTWEISGGTLASATTGSSIDFTVGPSGTVLLTVTASNACGSAGVSRSVPIAAPTASVSGATIDRGASANLTVTLTGTAPWTIHWQDGVVQSGIQSSPATRAVSPQVTTAYTLTSVSDASCAGTVAGSGTATVTVIPPPPAWIAAASDNLVVNVSWPPVSGIPSYRVERSTSRTGAFALVALTSALGFQDTVPASASPVTYVYRIRSRDTANTLSRASDSPLDFATTATVLFAEPISAGATMIQAAHIAELRNAIDALRNATSSTLAPAFGGAPSLADAPIVAADFTALVDALDATRAFWGLAPFQYAGVPLPQPGGLVYAAHITQLREAVK
jgi:YD repeat-containing protein